MNGQTRLCRGGAGGGGGAFDHYLDLVGREFKQVRFKKFKYFGVDVEVSN